MLAIPAVSRAPLPVVIGYPSNFDAFNKTGGEVNGFEIEADGITPADVTRVFGMPYAGASCYIRYCQGTVMTFPGGVHIRWSSPVDPTTHHSMLAHRPQMERWRRVRAAGRWVLARGIRQQAASTSESAHCAIRQRDLPMAGGRSVESGTADLLLWRVGSGPGNSTTTATPVPIPQPVSNILPGVVGGERCSGVRHPPAPAAAAGAGTTGAPVWRCTMGEGVQAGAE